MFDITLFLTLSALALIGLTITSITLHHLRLDIDQWGDKVLKTVLIFTLPILTLFKPKPQHFRQIFHILSGPPSSLMDQALAVCLATSSQSIFLFLAQKIINHCYIPLKAFVALSPSSPAFGWSCLARFYID